MADKENVYEGISQTGAVACATGQNDGEREAKNASAVLGKFKDVDALAKAYGALEAEFTRRSQRLKELERKTENFSFDGEQKGKRGESGAEKLRENAAMRKAEERAFDAFVSELEAANACAAKPEEVAIKEKPVDQTDAPIEETRQAESKQAAGLDGGSTQGAASAPTKEEKGENTSVVKSREQAVLSGDELYERASRDEAVRLRIIGEYLSSIGKAAVPLVQGGAGTLAAPPLRPKSIDEAGDMALRFFKKEAVQA